MTIGWCVWESVDVWVFVTGDERETNVPFKLSTCDSSCKISDASSTTYGVLSIIENTLVRESLLKELTNSISKVVI